MKFKSQAEPIDVGLPVVLLLLIFISTYIILDYNYTHEKRRERGHAAAIAWNSYMVPNCRVVGKTFGATYRVLKTTATLDGVTLLCSDGVFYTLGRDTYDNLAACVSNVDLCENVPESSIPKAPPL